MSTEAIRKGMATVLGDFFLPLLSSLLCPPFLGLEAVSSSSLPSTSPGSGEESSIEARDSLHSDATFSR